MKHGFRKTIACGLLSLLSLMLLCWPTLHYGYDVSDSINCLVTTGQHSTQYAVGYGDAAFANVRLGMTREKVLQLLGEPLKRYEVYWPDYGWSYAQPASSSGHYHLRDIRFSQDGKVTDVFKVFYFD
ncbi:MAG TPA: hypothetical protein VNT99_04165 [Methylomirabilota bacterium]|nr:hypothetical protein [Methylomirabilota bacterium]